jgi:phosphopantothenoylcysteine decarboxylase
MYEHPLTSEHLRVVKEVVQYTIVGPIGKNLACGDVGEPIVLLADVRLTVLVGIGAMTEWKDIVQIVVDRFQLSRVD